MEIIKLYTKVDNMPLILIIFLSVAVSKLVFINNAILGLDYKVQTNGYNICFINRVQVKYFQADIVIIILFTLVHFTMT